MIATVYLTAATLTAARVLWLAAVPRERTVTARSVSALMATLAVLAGMLIVGAVVSGWPWGVAYVGAAGALLLALAMPAEAEDVGPGPHRPTPLALLFAGGVVFLLARVGWLAA